MPRGGRPPEDALPAARDRGSASQVTHTADRGWLGPGREPGGYLLPEAGRHRSAVGLPNQGAQGEVWSLQHKPLSAVSPRVQKRSLHTDL